MKIEIIKGHDSPTLNKFKTKAGKDMELYEQKAYMFSGGAFPVEFKISHEKLSDALPVGQYQICPTSFETNNFGGISLSQYNTKFIPLI